MNQSHLSDTWLDRAIRWLSPGWGAKRIRARAAAGILLKYEAARMDRRLSNWRTTDSSANAEIGPALAQLRQRSRDLVRNNAYATRAVDELVGHMIGTGITAQADLPEGKDSSIAKQINEAWKVWIEECDADGQLDFYGIQRLVAREVVESGECLVRMRPRSSDDGFLVPMQLQIIEADQLDTGKTELTNTGYIIQGVEFDLLGRRIAYWLFPNHPGEVFISHSRSSNSSRRVDAGNILHIYRKDRLQVRGVPWLAPVIVSMRDLDEYCEAELVRKKIEACFSTFVTQPDAGAGPSIGEVQAQDSQIVETVEPGMIRYLRPGEEVTFGVPSGTGNGYRDFMRDIQTRIASGIGITYEQLTGDLSNVNYSSFRAGLLSFRNHIDAFRWLIFIPMFCKPARRWFIDSAYAAGLISARNYRTVWSPPSYGSVDPEKDARAILSRIRMGIQTWEQAVGEEGYDPEEQRAAIRRINEAWDRDGIVLDCDPRWRTKTGSAITGNNEDQASNNQEE
jgi:lambda family phage portal protein